MVRRADLPPGPLPKGKGLDSGASRNDEARPPVVPPLRRGDMDSRFRGNDGGLGAIYRAPTEKPTLVRSLPPRIPAVSLGTLTVLPRLVKVGWLGTLLSAWLVRDGRVTGRGGTAATERD